MNQVTKATGSRGPKAKAHELIVAAAYEAVSDLGLAGANIETIARLAGVSRPTVYKYFPNGKPDIIDYLSVAEAANVHDQIKAGLVHSSGFAQTLTEALLLTVRIAGKNPFIRRITESYELTGWPRSAGTNMFAMHRKWWERLVTGAKERGELAVDLDVDEVISWLTVVETSLLTWMSGPKLSDKMLRRLIQRFYVDPLLSERPREVPPVRTAVTKRKVKR